MGGSYLDIQDAFGLQENNNPDRDLINLVVSTTTEFPQYQTCLKEMVPVVTPDWVTDSIKWESSIPQRPYSPDPKFFFSKVCATVAGIPQGDTAALLEILLGFGGQYSDSPKYQTTHVITTDNNHPYCMLVRDKKPDVKIVLPHWIDDCCRLRRRLDETPYLLPNPSILSGHSQSLSSLEINDLHIEGNAPDSNDSTVGMPAGDLESSSESGSLRFSQSEGRRLSENERNLFKGKHFYLGQDLDLHQRSKRALSAVIQQAGGKLLDQTDITNSNADPQSNIYIGKWRNSNEYVTASRKGWIVGNLEWVVWMITNEEWQLPTKNLLHYPLVQGGLKELNNVSIALTGFTGESRQRCIRLIEALGASYNHALTIKCQLLITSSKRSAKYRAALKYNLNVVNNLWLEETYSKWEFQAVTNPRYVDFSAYSDSIRTAHFTELDTQVLKRFYCSNVEINNSDNSRLPSSSRPSAHDKGKREPHAATFKSNSLAEPGFTTGLSQKITNVSAQKGKTQASSNPAPDLTNIKTQNSDNKAFVNQNRDLAASNSSNSSGHQEKGEEDTNKENRGLKNSKIIPEKIDTNAFSLKPNDSDKTPKTPSPSKPETANKFSKPGSAVSDTPSVRVRGSARKAQQSAAAKLKADVEDMNQYEKVKKRKLQNLPLPEELMVADHTHLDQTKKKASDEVTEMGSSVTESGDTNGTTDDVEMIDVERDANKPRKHVKKKESTVMNETVSTSAKKRNTASSPSSLLEKGRDDKHDTPTKSSTAKSRKRQKLHQDEALFNKETGKSLSQDEVINKQKSLSAAAQSRENMRRSATPNTSQVASTGNSDTLATLSMTPSKPKLALSNHLSHIKVVGAPLHILPTSLTLPSQKMLDSFALLGVFIEDQPSKCNYVISTKLARTEKLIKALAHGVRLIGPKFFQDLACAIDGTDVPAYLYADHSNSDKKDELIVDVTDARYLMPNDPQSCDQGFTTESVFLANYNRYGHMNAKTAKRVTKPGDDCGPLFRDYTFNYKQGTGVYGMYDSIAQEHGSNKGVEMKSFRTSRVTMLSAKEGIKGLREIAEYVDKSTKSSQEDDATSGASNEHYKVKILITKPSSSKPKNSDSAYKPFIKSVESEGYIPIVVSSQWLIKCIFRSKVDFTSDVLWPTV